MKQFRQAVPDEEYRVYNDHASSETVGCSSHGLSSSHAPSDGSIDLSVKSVNLSKEALGRYLKKKANPGSGGLGCKNEVDPETCRSSQSTSSASCQQATTTTAPGPVHLHVALPVPTHLRIPQLYGGPTTLHSSLKYKVSPHVHNHQHNVSPPLYSSPPPIPRPSAENPYDFSIGGLLSKPYSHAPSPSIDSIYSRPHGHNHNHNPSATSFGYEGARSSSRSEFVHLPFDGLGSAKRETSRIRIPSNPSVTSRNSIGRISSSSIEHLSERGSPMPNFHVEVLSPGRPAADSRSSLSDYPWANSGTGSKFKPAPDELRR